MYFKSGAYIIQNRVGHVVKLKVRPLAGAKSSPITIPGQADKGLLIVEFFTLMLIVH